MAKLRKLIIERGSRIWGVFQCSKYELRDGAIFETKYDEEKFIAWIEPKKNVSEWLKREIKETIEGLTKQEEEKMDSLKKWLEALQTFGVPIVYEGGDEEDEADEEDY